MENNIVHWSPAHSDGKINTSNWRLVQPNVYSCSPQSSTSWCRKQHCYLESSTTQHGKQLQYQSPAPPYLKNNTVNWNQTQPDVEPETVKLKSNARWHLCSWKGPCTLHPRSQKCPHCLVFTCWGCCSLCLWHKPTEPAHSFLFSSCVNFCLYGPFNCISFHKFSRISPASHCSSDLISALLVLSTKHLFMKVSLSPDIILCGWLGSKHRLTNWLYTFTVLN